jgi:hypothetical protein
MELTGAGTAIMIAIAAALWFAYFVPTWVRRREYLDTERTATRLQQTLRVMAETAELPDRVRVEVSARDAARQERILRAEQRRADAMAARTAASIRAATPSAPAATHIARAGASPASSAAEMSFVDSETAGRRRRRRAHRLATVLMAAATVTIGIQLGLAVATGMAPGGWLVLGAGAALGVAGVTVRRRLDARSAPRAAASPRATASVAEPVAVAPVRRASAWTPVPVPKPLYLGRPEAQTVQPAPDVAARLHAAALAAEQELRAAHEEPEVVPFRPQRRPAPETIEAPTAHPSAPSRWAAMGRVDGTDAAAPDLDEVLRRRRSAG